MIVTGIGVNGYRNLGNFNQSLSPGINVICGNNAQGKTNFIEAVYFLAFGRQFRHGSDIDVIKWKQKSAYITSELEKNGISYSLNIRLEARGKNLAKEILFDRIPIRHMKELFGKLLIVMFSPEDLKLIKSGPGERRRFIDMEICQLSPVYYNDLKEYYKTLKQRNSLLKQIQKDKSLKVSLDIWDEQLVKHGSRITNYRDSFIKKLSDISGEIHSNLTGGAEKLSVKYKPSITSVSSLQANQNKDILVGFTKEGVHHDDMDFYINGINVRQFGSQGQQRTVALSAKLAQIKIISETTGQNPVLLLDDVFSELDKTRQEFLLGQIHDIQTIITCTGIEDVLNNKSDYKLMKMEQGFLSEA